MNCGPAWALVGCAHRGLTAVLPKGEIAVSGVFYGETHYGLVHYVYHQQFFPFGWATHSGFAHRKPSLASLWVGPTLVLLHSDPPRATCGQPIIDLPIENPHTDPKGQNGCGPCVDAPNLDPGGISVHFARPHSPTVHPHLPTVDPAWVSFWHIIHLLFI